MIFRSPWPGYQDPPDRPPAQALRKIEKPSTRAATAARVTPVLSPAIPPRARQAAYALLIALAAGAAAGRILSVERTYAPNQAWPATLPRALPTFGDNDRSRWDTVRALVEKGTYVLGHRDHDVAAPTASALLAGPDGLQAVALAAAVQEAPPYRDRGIVTERGWRTNDKVLRPDTQDFYSSKPPFLSTLVAGLYWLLRTLLGWSLVYDPFEVVRTILLVVNGLTFLVYLRLLARLAERWGASDWGRLYVVAAGCFATLVTPFLTTLNNHTVATFCALFALYPVASVWADARQGRRPRAYLFLLAGFFAALTTCFELPAAALAAGLFAVLLWRAPGRTLALALPAAAVPVAAFLLTNYLAIGRLVPAYGEFGGPWYEYAGSYWSNGMGRGGIDAARTVEGLGDYVYNCLFGHHGWFSLTPMWTFAVAGMLAGVARLARRRTAAPAPARRAPEAEDRAPAFLYPLTLAVSAVVIGFYLLKTNNYGGMTSGLRWLMWLTPLWLLCMLPALDRLAGRRWGRRLAYALLAVSALSAAFPALNPWSQPWLYHYQAWSDFPPY